MASPPPALLHLLGQATRARPAVRFARAARDPEAAQRAKLADILGRNAGAEYPRTFGLSGQTHPEAFARSAPLIGHDELAPWVQRQMAGERNVLTAEAPVYYAQTTGSTGAHKRIPITPSYRAEFQQTVHVALWHLYLKFPGAFRSRALYFVGSRRAAIAPDGNDIGTMSGFNFTELPPLLRSIYAWPYELFEVTDLKTRSYLALWLAAIADPSLVAGIFPAPIVYLLRDLGRHAPDLARDVRAGRLPQWLALDEVQRAAFAQRIVARPDLAERFERAARAPDEEKVRELWPKLRLVYCWTTATAGLYVPELKRRLGPQVAVRDAIYSACEGWCSIPMGEEASGGALAITSHYFEFIEEAKWDAGGREAVPAWAVEDGKRYYIVVTNSAGLYRYVLHDVVEVCGFYKRTPRIRFVRKAGASTNLLGEKLDEDMVNRAVAPVLQRLRLETTCFTLAPKVVGERPSYTLFFEPAQHGAPGTSPDALRALGAQVDAALSDVALEYGRLRKNELLGPVQVELLPPGSYDAFRQAKVAQGSAEAQLKIPHLVADAAAVPARRA